jgi:hypothetical protein
MRGPVVPGQSQVVHGPVPPRSATLRALALFGMLAILSCEMLGPAAPLPDGAVRFEPPLSYQTWWSRTQACAALDGTLESIRWYAVPHTRVFSTEAGPEVGRWSRGGNGIEIVIADAYLNNEMVIRHEMLHALLDQSGHPAEYFVDRCHLTWDSWRGE